MRFITSSIPADILLVIFHMLDLKGSESLKGEIGAMCMCAKGIER